MNLRIIETFKEMFNEPRISAVMLFIGAPTLGVLVKNPDNLQGAGIVAIIMFIYCFLIVRFSL